MPRDTFDEAAELYERARPRYPGPLVADLVRVAGIGPGSRVLEIGPGTGKLTVDLARSGCRITGVELGPALADVARRRLREFPAARVVTADFDRWGPPPEPYDAVVCATAFHWLDPVHRVARAAGALRPGGHLALVTTLHVAGGTQEFFDLVQGCYERWMPGTPPGLRLPPEAQMATHTAELDDSPYFTDVTVHRHAQEITYTADAYTDVLLTYSNHRALAAPARRGLLACVRGLLESRFDGVVTKRYLHELITARRCAD
ncbi:class I SAM-dependent methyltransferase [Streptomyces sp. NPDC026672]|uniref:class I SAM-dependent methyltransferase n=1 Tax=unclassified Streptomyces TaxID=2593676 RepID=UPI0033C4D4F4